LIEGRLKIDKALYQLGSKMAASHKDAQQIELARRLNHVPWNDEYEKMISGML